MPLLWKMEKLKTGEMVSLQSGKVIVMCWKDKKDVPLLRSQQNAEMLKVKYGEKKPELFVNYNGTAVGVDRIDQHLADYPDSEKGTSNIARKCSSSS